MMMDRRESFCAVAVRTIIWISTVNWRFTQLVKADCQEDEPGDTYARRQVAGRAKGQFIVEDSQTGLSKLPKRAL
jgi:hypothetical protein